ncbi:MAG: NUDIX hydrolase [Lachnospiraceae bacterium]|nr:NUDIX hydrolase [Lachnospiraceae bacterium]
MEHVERQSRKLVHKGSILDMYEDVMLCPDGTTEVWDFVSHRNGAAAVVPVTPDGRILMCRQYRPALERYTWEIPAGSRDSRDEPTFDCAKRELKEETGYDTDNWKRLLSLKSTVAFCDELIDIYLAKDVVREGEQELDSAEDISIKLFTLDELTEKIYAGEIQDGKTVAGIMAYAYQTK